MAFVVVGRCRKSWARERNQRETRRNGWRVFYEGVRNFVSVKLHPMTLNISLSVIILNMYKCSRLLGHNLSY
jgi:hypothetical protein